MTETQIKDYLNKYSLTTKEKLAQHILELKRNTKPNLELISQLNYVLVDEENLFFNIFSRENKTKDFWGVEQIKKEIEESLHSYGAKIDLPTFKKQCAPQCFCDESCKNPQKYNFGLIEQLNHVVGDLEGINKPPQAKVSPHFLDEVLEQVNSAEKEYKQKILYTHPSDFVDMLLDALDKKEIERNFAITNCFYTKCNQKSCECCYPNSTKEIKTEETKGHSTRLKANTPMEGVKETQSVEKAPIFTYCKVNKNALEALSLRALYGHKKYEKGDDWENFSRVPNGDFEYANSQFRHALNIGEENEKEHLISSAWNAVARLEIYLRKNNE